MATRKRLPMIVAPLFDSPAALQLSASAYGMLWRLCMHAWAIEFAPMPVAESDWRHIARAHAPQWRMHRDLIRQAFDHWYPIAQAYHAQRLAGAARLRIAAAKGAALRTSKAHAQSIQAAVTARAPVATDYLAAPKREPAPPRPLPPDKRPPRPIRSDRLTRTA